MVLRCLRAELMKCRRAPVWLAFLVLPSFPRCWAPSTTWATWRCWTPAGTACGPSTPCLPPCSSSPPSSACSAPGSGGWSTPTTTGTPPSPPRCQCVRSTWASCCWTWGCPPWPWPSSACSFSSAAGWQVSPPLCPRSCPAGWPSALGCTAVCAVQLYLSLAIRAFAPPVAIALVGGIFGLLLTSQGFGRLSLLPALPGYAGQQPPDGPALPSFLAGCGFYLLLFSLLAVRRLSPPGCRHRVKHTPACHSTRGMFYRLSKRSFRRQEGL